MPRRANTEEKVVNFFRFFVNPSADSPTAGFRGMLVLAAAATFSYWAYRQSEWLILLIVALGGLVISLGLFDEAARNVDK